MRRADRGRPTAGDLVLALGLTVAAQVEVWVTGSANGPRPLGAVVAVLACVPLAWRRQQPLVSAGGAVAALLVSPLVGEEVGSLSVAVAILITVHAVAAYLPWRTAVAAAGAILVTSLAGTLTQPNRHAGDVAWTLVVTGGIFTAGRVMSRLGADAAEHVEQLIKERDEHEREALIEERRRMARELHDVIAHGVAIMVVQAGAAEELIHHDPDRAAQLLQSVQRTGSHAAEELARLLDLLGSRRDDLAPTPGLGDLATLTDGLRASGLSVQLSCDELLPAMAPDVELAVYRIVQEALTNVVKHAGTANAHVAITATPESLGVVVANDAGQGEGQRPSATTGGRGLIGMRERVRLHGGTIQAGPTTNGFTVAVLLPVDPAWITREAGSMT